jgi:hypothetical protein
MRAQLHSLRGPFVDRALDSFVHFAVCRERRHLALPYGDPVSPNYVGHALGSSLQGRFGLNVLVADAASA